MDFKKIAIIGVGLMGSSFALALKKRGFTGTITGVGRSENNLIAAKKAGIIDDYSTVHADGIKDADLILLATPVGGFKSIVEDIKQNIKQGAIVTDLGSVKADIIEKVEPLMPEGVYFVGGHPITGKECSGISAADADLYNNARCIITPGPDTNKEALNTVIKLWESVGANTMIMTPDEHDLIFAAVSHLPHVVAYALVNSILDVKNDILGDGGRGLKDMTRIALSPTVLWRDICESNKEHILTTLRSFTYSLSKMAKFMEEDDWDALEAEFLRAKEARQLIESD